MDKKTAADNTKKMLVGKVSGFIDQYQDYIASGEFSEQQKFFYHVLSIELRNVITSIEMGGDALENMISNIEDYRLRYDLLNREKVSSGKEANLIYQDFVDDLDGLIFSGKEYYAALMGGE